MGDFPRNIVGMAGRFLASAVGLFVLLACLSHAARDASWSVASGFAPQNLLGMPGAIVADIALQLLGYASYPLAILLLSVVLHSGNTATRSLPASLAAMALQGIWAGFFAVSASAFAALTPASSTWPFIVGNGGFVGDLAIGYLLDLFLFFHLPFPVLMAAMFTLAAAVFFLAQLRLLQALHFSDLYRAAFLCVRGVIARTFDAYKITKNRFRPAYAFGRNPSQGVAATATHDALPLEEAVQLPKPKPALVRRSKKRITETQKPSKAKKHTGYHFPDVGLLAEDKPVKKAPMEDNAAQNAARLEKVLREFSVQGAIIGVKPGPVVTLFEFEPAAGVKSSRVIALAEDIARSMSAVSCRVAVVPGRNVIGVELPNPTREIVYLRSLFTSSVYTQSDANLPLCLGKDISGAPVVVDLAGMPHLLIAGTTGSGKSVGVNTMILSLLYARTPEDCRLLMIDPKMLELSVYEGIPHLLAPVVTDPKKAVVALKWVVAEMERRYKRMAEIGVRNISGYNAYQRKQNEGTADKKRNRASMQEQEQQEDTSLIPYIVVVIDEMADLMMVAGKDVENAVQRLAQMARAAGIHIVMATQRPSVDVITGTIKANFPTRMSFQVTSKIDSRTILGEQGAEALLGKGDMLFMEGGGRIKRIHGAFVSDSEVRKIVTTLKTEQGPVYNTDVVGFIRKENITTNTTGSNSEENGEDTLYDRAIALVLRDERASTSYIQRRLQIGYNRAADLMERMEEEGVVSPANARGKREILARKGHNE